MSTERGRKAMTLISAEYKHETVLFYTVFSLSMYFNTKILAQFAKTKIMMIGKILNTDKINLNLEPKLNYVRQES